MTNYYVCEICGKQFSRKTTPAVLQCKGCKREATYSRHPGQKQAHEEARKNGCLAKYGVSNPSLIPGVQKKLSVKAIARFEDLDRKAEMLEKRAITNIEKYGCAAAMQNPEIARKNVESQLANTGYVGWQNRELNASAQLLAHTEEANEKRKATSLANWGEDHHFKNKEVLSRQWNSYKEKTGFDHPAHNPEIKHSIKGYFFEEVHFDSSWELAYFIWLRDNNKAFIYHPPFYLTYVDEGATHHQYQPDFLVEGKFVEIKGDHFFNEKNEPYNHYEKAFWWNKYNALLANKVEILRFEEVKQYLRYVKEKYGKDYLRSFKRR